MNKHVLGTELKKENRGKERWGKGHTERKNLNLRPRELPLSLSTWSRHCQHPFGPTRQGWRPCYTWLCPMHSWPALTPQPLLSGARSSLSLLSAAIWCSGDPSTKTERGMEERASRASRWNWFMSSVEGASRQGGARKREGKGGAERMFLEYETSHR